MYFVQARLILNILDTKAAEGLFGLVATSNSKFGCLLCKGVTGLHDGKKCNYFGHRNFLPLEHYLRYCGQTGRCCPKGFYDPKTEDAWFSEPRFDFDDKGGIHKSFFVEDYNVVEDITKTIYSSFNNKALTPHDKGKLAWKVVKKFMKDYDLSMFESCEDADSSINNEILRFLFVQPLQLPYNNATVYAWYHKGDFGFNDNITDPKKGIRAYLYYRHFDFRKQNPYKRITNDEYVEIAKEAERMNEANKVKKPFPHEGVKNLWPLSRLPYADFERQFTWPFLHAIEGFISKCIEIIGKHYTEYSDVPAINTNANIKAKDGEAPNEKKKPNFRPAYKKNEAPYEATTAELKTAAEWLNCVLLPKGLDDQ